MRWQLVNANHKCRSNQNAVSFSHVEARTEHSSVTDSSRGFGGKYGVLEDMKDNVGDCVVTIVTFVLHL